MIRWIFFDVGNVLFNDSPQDFEAFRFFHRAIQAVDVHLDFEQLLREREALAAAGSPRILAQLASRWLDADGIRGVYLQARQYLFSRYDEHNLLNDGVDGVIDALRGDFRLGIIANQPPECRPSLARRKLVDHFEIVAISEEIGLHKPNPEIFRWAIERSGSSPEECVMVGDRQDNDVIPASNLGMKTIRLDWPNHRAKNWFPTDPEAIAFLESTDRVSYYGANRADVIAPNRTVQSLSEVPGAIDKLARA